MLILHLLLLNQDSILLSTIAVDISETTTREITTKEVTTITVSTTTPRTNETTTAKGRIEIWEKIINYPKMYLLIRTK